MLPRMSRGQQLVLSPVGAYNLTQSMQFIRYRPAAVMILESGEDIEIKRRETLADVENTESDLPFEQKIREIA
jgi:diaminopimelate decarboxylase